MLIKHPPRLTNKSSLIKYVETDLWTWMRDVANAFSRNNFTDNFQSFTVKDLYIKAGEEIAIPNEFKNRYPGAIPVGRIVIRQNADANIIDGTNEWTPDLVFLLNPSDNDVIITVLFFN